MRRSTVVVALCGLVSWSPLRAQEGEGPLVVQADPQNVVASSLAGRWRLDEDLNRRLGNRGGVNGLEFRDDPTVVAKIPATLASRLREHRIFLAGTMVKGAEEHLFLVTENAGNPVVVWFRPRGDDPHGDAELWNVALVRAEARSRDLLFVGGDFNNQSFAAYAREAEVVGGQDPAAALADMIRLLEAGKAEEFVDTYVAPRDLAELNEQGRTKEMLVERFKGERVEVLIERMKSVTGLPPTMDASGDLATWPLEDTRGEIRLQRIDGRWYVRS